MSRLSDRAGLIGLAAFLAVDVLLVAVAVQSTRGSAAGSGAPVVATSSSSRSSTATTAADATSGVEVVPVGVGIFGVDADTALRFVVGSCRDGGSKLELTTDGGRSWKARPEPFDALVRVKVRGNGSSFAVGARAADGCRPSIRQATKYDADWGNASAVNDAWYRDPRDERAVGLPTGGTGRPCGSKAVVDLAITDRGAAALCPDGTVLVSRAGAAWDKSAKVPGALALALDDTSRSFAVVPGSEGCRGLSVVDAAKPTAVVGCVEADLATVKPGTVALSVAGSNAWMRVGGAVFRASADLSTWRSS
jgi:hypothetical protein